MLRAAIVGCGSIAKTHASVLNEIEEAQLVAFADIQFSRAEAMAQQFGGNAYHSLSQMLCKEKIDILHICTPHYLHVPMIQAALKNNIGVFTEKPPAINREAWGKLKALDVKQEVGICFQNRYNKNVQYLKKLLKEDTTGKILSARAFLTWNRNKEYYETSGWRGKVTTEGGSTLINQAIHTLDLLLYFMGTPIQMECNMSNHHLKNVIETEDTLEAMLTFPSAKAVLYATTAYDADEPVIIEFRCEHKTIRLEGQELYIKEPSGQIKSYSFDQETVTNGKKYWGNGHHDCIQDFYRRRIEGKGPFIGVKEVDTTMNTMFSMYEEVRK